MQPSRSLFARRPGGHGVSRHTPNDLQLPHQVGGWGAGERTGTGERPVKEEPRGVSPGASGCVRSARVQATGGSARNLATVPTRRRFVWFEEEGAVPDCR